jgi:hypothetical protein
MVGLFWPMGRESRYREGELAAAASVEGLREEAAHND